MTTILDFTRLIIHSKSYGDLSPPESKLLDKPNLV